MKKRIVILSVLSVLVGTQVFSDMRVIQPGESGAQTHSTRTVPSRPILPLCQISGNPLTVSVDQNRIGTLDADPQELNADGTLIPRTWSFFPNSEHTIYTVSADKGMRGTAVSAQKGATDLVFDPVIPISGPGREGHQCTVRAQGPTGLLQVRINGTRVGTYHAGRLTFPNPNARPER